MGFEKATFYLKKNKRGQGMKWYHLSALTSDQRLLLQC